MLLAWLALAAASRGEEFSALCSDRSAVERVYYQHRLGEKPAFEKTLPQATLEKFVRSDLRKEAVLKQVYGVEITSSMLEAEVARINTTTRAPEILAEIKNALGNDPARFANGFAKSILVERLLRDKFQNDDALHSPQRRQAEQTRNELLAARTDGAACDRLVTLLRGDYSNAVSETTWQLAARPAAESPTAQEIEIKKRFGPQAQLVSSPRAAGEDTKMYFEDLPAELQKVLRAQLRHPGDVSAIIEMPGVFLLYVAKEKTDAVLSVAGLSLPKRSYEQWLAEQSGN